METGQFYDLLARGFVKPEDQEPDVTGFDFYLDAFGELSTSRPSGLGIQAIPFTAIAEYFRIYELTDFDEFVYVIRRMDFAFMELSAKASANEGKKKNAGGNANSKNHNQGRHGR